MRAIQVKMVKEAESESVKTNDKNFEDRVALVSATVNKTIKLVTVCVFGYVALDTVRRVVQAKAYRQGL